MNFSSAFFIGLIIGIVITIVTFYAIYYVEVVMPQKQSGATENYSSIDRDKDIPKWFPNYYNDGDKLAKQFLRGKVKISA